MHSRVCPSRMEMGLFEIPDRDDEFGDTYPSQASLAIERNEIPQTSPCSQVLLIPQDTNSKIREPQTKQI